MDCRVTFSEVRKRVFRNDANFGIGTLAARMWLIRGAQSGSGDGRIVARGPVRSLPVVVPEVLGRQLIAGSHNALILLRVNADGASTSFAAHSPVLVIAIKHPRTVSSYRTAGRILAPVFGL